MKEPTGKKPMKSKVHIRQTPRPIRDPRKVEKFWPDDGQRMTRVDYGPLSQGPVEDITAASRAYRKLGLSGLPEG